MNLALNIVSAVVVLGCFVYICIKKDKNIAILIMSSILLAALLAQIVLDEVVRTQILAMENLHSIRSTLAIVQYIDWGKGLLIFLLAIYCINISGKQNDEEDEV